MILFKWTYVISFLLCCENFNAHKLPIFYGDNGQHQTVPFPLHKNRERQAFQREILQFLGLNKAPHPREPNEEAAPSYMIDLYKSILSGKEDEEIEETNLNPHFQYLDSSNQMVHSSTDLFDIAQADTVVSFVNQESHVVPSLSIDSADAVNDEDWEKFEHLHFDLGDIRPEYRLIGAELRIYQNDSLSSPPTKTPKTLNVFAVRAASDDRRENLHLIASSKLNKNKIGWIVLNVTTALERWRNFPNENYGLLTEVVDDEGARHNPNGFGLSNAFMVGFFNADNHHAHKRIKRSPRQDVSFRDDYGDFQTMTGMDSRWARTICQKRTLYVSFSELGWQDWIIAPDGYAAYYCLGECSFPLTNSLNATNHAIVQTLAHLMNPENVPKPCCAPTKLSPISVLFFDDSSNVVLKKYNHMVVKTCGCH